MVEGVTHPFPAHDVTERVASWWHEAESAVKAKQLPRARRFLRWILACCPDDEEAWLWMARLAPDPEERLACLHQAYLVHPDSTRIVAALRQARGQHMASAVGELKPWQARVRCLPDARQRVDGTAAQTDGRKEPASQPAEKTSPRSQPPSGGSGYTLPYNKKTSPHDKLARSGKMKRHSQLWSLPHILDVSTVDFAAWLAFLVPLLAYFLTACSTVYNLDSAEFAAAVHVLGIVRATGYPLYLLLGKVFTLLLPVGDVAFRLNVMSAVCAAGTVALLYHILRQLTGQRAAALAASLLFAFSYYFWAQAVVAEVYTLHTLLMMALFLFLLRWEATWDDRLLAACGLLYGLSFGNHMSTLLLAPGIGLFLLVVSGRAILHPRRILLFLVPFVAGLGVYAYLPIRYLAQPAFNYAGHYDAVGRFVPLDMTRARNLWWLVSGQGFQDLMFGYASTELFDEVGQAAYRLWGTFLGIGLVPGLLGIWIQARRRPRYLALFGLAFLANLVFFINYRVVDKETMFLPAYVIGAVWVGEGYAWLIRWVQGRRGGEIRPSPAWAWGLATLAIVTMVVNWPLVDVHADTRARDRASTALTMAQPEAIIFGWWTSAPPLHYQQLVEGQRPDILVINRFLIGAEEMYALIDRSLGHRPVYVMELDEGLIGAYRPVPVGPMFELVPQPLAGVEP